MQESGTLHDATVPYREALAVRLDAVARRTGSRWHAARAEGLRRRPERVAECGHRVVMVTACDHGTGRVAMVRCGDRHACAACAQRAMRRWSARMRASIERAIVERARGRGRSRDVLRMLTLTVRHSGDVARDRERIARAWHRHRAWMRACARVRPAYWAVWEITPGRDGRGHVHLHVVLAAPWYDYARARAAWCAHAEGESARYDARAVRAQDASRAIAYLAGYLTSATKADEWRTAPVELRAAWWAACYARRAVTAHRGAWVAYHAACPCCGVVTTWMRPAPGTERAPEAALAALARARAAASAPHGPVLGCGAAAYLAAHH